MRQYFCVYCGKPVSHEPWSGCCGEIGHAEPDEDYEQKFQKPAVTAERLREVLHYDPETGVFTWRVNRGNRTKAGTVAGGHHCEGYITINFDGRQYLAHRLAWFYTHGSWPEYEIDHLNGIRKDNRLRNLRDVMKNMNQQNTRLARRSNLSSGLLGVSRHHSQWRARIVCDGKVHLLGGFATPELAHAAYLEAKRQFQPGCTI